MRNLQLRRGTKAQLNSITLLAGELGFTTDTKEIFVGDGTNHQVVGSIKSGDYSNMPAAGVANRLFHVTSGANTGDTFIDNGTSWIRVGVSDLDDVVDGAVYGKVKNTELVAGQVVQVRAEVAGTNVTGDTIKTHMDDVTQHRVISDSTTTATSLWSSSKISTELATKTDKVGSASAGDIASLDATGNLVDAGYKLNDLGIDNVSLWSANKIKTYTQQLQAAMDYQSDVLAKQVDNLLDPGASPAVGDRYLLTNVSNLHANFGSIAGVSNNDLVSYNGTVFEVAYDVSVLGSGAICWDKASQTWQYYDGTVWGQQGGLTGVTAGIGLVKDGNTVHVNLGAGIAELPTDEVGIDVASVGGLSLTSVDTSGQLQIKKDITSGVNVAPINLSSNGTGIAIDNSTIEHTTGSLHVKAAGVTEAHLNASVAGAGLIGGAGTALTVNPGNGVEVTSDKVTLTPDTTTGATVAPTTVTANGIGTTIDNSSLTHTAGSISVKAAGVTEIHLNSSVAGAGLSGGAGSALGVNVGDGVAIVSDNVVVDLAINAGLQFSTGKLDAKLNSSASLAKDGNGMGVVLDATGGLEHNTVNGIRLKAAVAGDGLAHTAGVLSVNAGDGLTTVSDNVAINLATDAGLQFSTGKLDAKVNGAASVSKDANGLAVVLDASGGLEHNGSNGIRLKATSAGDGLSLTTGVLNINVNNGLALTNDSVGIKADITTGASVAPVSITANGTGVSVDSVSILHTNGVLEVGSIDCGVFL